MIDYLAAKMFPAMAAEPQAPAPAAAAPTSATTTPEAPAPEAQADEPLPQSDEALGAKQYGSEDDLAFMQPPAEIAAERKARGAEMFADGDNAETRLALQKAIDTITPGVPATLSQATQKEWIAIGGDLGIGAAGVKEIATVARECFADGTPAPHVLAAWRAQGQVIVGSTDPEVMAEAKRLVQRDPRVKSFLAATRLGDHPVVLRKMIAAAKVKLGRR